MGSESVLLIGSESVLLIGSESVLLIGTELVLLICSDFRLFLDSNFGHSIASWSGPLDGSVFRLLICLYLVLMIDSVRVS